MKELIFSNVTTSIEKRVVSTKNLQDFNYNILSGLKSEKTLKDYYFYLINFLKTIYELNDANPKPNDIIGMLYNINEVDIVNYILILKNERNLKHSSINKIISALKHFFKEIQVRDKNFINPIKNIKMLKSDPYDPENILRLTKEDIKKMIESINVENEKELRNILIMKTLYYTGMRSSEIRNLNYKDIIKKENRFFIKLEKTKSQKMQYIPLMHELAIEIENYKSLIKESFLLQDIEDKLVFPANYIKNSVMTANGLNFMLKKIANKAIDKNISAHNFRHAIATEMLLSEENISISDVQDFLRHSDIKTTKKYDDAVELKKQKVVEKIPKI
jgi:integrase/recombinase XerD